MFLPLALLPIIMADPFWMTVEVLRVDWRGGCLNTGACTQPRFKILEDMLSLNEKVSISWPVEHSMQDATSSFISHWPSGTPEDLAVSFQVIGIDPTYGFPRICDRTASIRVFQEGVIGAFGRNLSYEAKTTMTALPEEELGKKMIEIQAKCFNVTVALQKHTEKCPWCLDPSNVNFIEQRLSEDPSSISHSNEEDNILYVSVMVLAGIAFLTSSAFAFVLIAFLWQKRLNRQVPLKPRDQPSSRLSKMNKEENRYDLPWDQTLPVTNLLSSSSKFEKTTTSAPQSSPFGTQSSIVTPHSLRSGCTLPQTHLYHHIPQIRQ